MSEKTSCRWFHKSVSCVPFPSPRFIFPRILSHCFLAPLLRSSLSASYFLESLMDILASAPPQRQSSLDQFNLSAHFRARPFLCFWSGEAQTVGTRHRTAFFANEPDGRVAPETGRTVVSPTPFSSWESSERGEDRGEVDARFAHRR